MNLYQRIAQVMLEAKYVQKTGFNGFHKYKYAKESDFIETLRPVLLKYGLLCFPISQKVTKEGELTTVEMAWRLQNIDNPDEFMVVPSAGQGTDKGDKGVYKAITGCKKYFLSTTFLIETGDDAEADEATDKGASVDMPAAEPTALSSAPVARKSDSWRKPRQPAAALAVAESEAEY